jgi:hypothetical protein
MFKQTPSFPWVFTSIVMSRVVSLESPSLEHISVPSHLLVLLLGLFFSTSEEIKIILVLRCAIPSPARIDWLSWDN